MTTDRTYSTTALSITQLFYDCTGLSQKGTKVKNDEERIFKASP